jgi:hypothetical protein
MNAGGEEMSKKMKIVAAIIAGVVLIGIIGTAAVLAAPPTTTPPAAGTAPARPDITVRAAQILGNGITADQLKAAIKQARTSLAPTATPNAPATPANPSLRPMRPALINPADLYAKVATILNVPGVTGDKIAAAFQQAGKEFRDQAITGALDKARVAGKISQADEDSIQAWLKSRPAALDKLGNGMPFGMGAMGPGIQGRMGNFRNHMNNFLGKFNGTPAPSPSTTK